MEQLSAAQSAEQRGVQMPVAVIEAGIGKRLKKSVSTSRNTKTLGVVFVKQVWR